jgi:hypothetical protein
VHSRADAVDNKLMLVLNVGIETTNEGIDTIERQCLGIMNHHGHFGVEPYLLNDSEYLTCLPEP